MLMHLSIIYHLEQAAKAQPVHGVPQVVEGADEVRGEIGIRRFHLLQLM